MPITAADLKFFDSERMTDDNNAGGRRGPNVLLTGAQNNIFPDITEDEALVGSELRRKVYPSVTAVGEGALRFASAVLDSQPADPNVSVVLVKSGDQNTTAGAVSFGAPLSSDIPIQANTFGNRLVTTGVISGGSTTLAINARSGAASFDLRFVVVLELQYAGGSFFAAPIFSQTGLSAFEARNLTLSAPFPGAAVNVPVTVIPWRSAFAQPQNTNAYAVSPLSGAQLAGATNLKLASPLVRAKSLAAPVALFASSQVCTVWHEAETAPATRANSDVVNVGRTNLSQVAVVDSAGNEIARAYANGPSTSAAGFTVDFAAGTVTCTNVSGWAQPVSIRHRIEERVSVSSVDTAYPFTGTGADSPLDTGPGDTSHVPALNLSAPLSREYPTGSFVSNEASLETLEPGVSLSFSQQAWTRVWSDSVIGASVGALYLGDIGLSADGAETDRWACVFTSSTQYTLHSERWGVIGNGNIGTDYVPLNPATNQPLLTLFAANWSAGGITVGHVFRFNTVGAYKPLWVVRSVYSGATEGPANFRLRLRGSIDA